LCVDVDVNIVVSVQIRWHHQAVK